MVVASVIWLMQRERESERDFSLTTVSVWFSSICNHTKQYKIFQYIYSFPKNSTNSIKTYVILVRNIMNNVNHT